MTRFVVQVLLALVIPAAAFAEGCGLAAPAFCETFESGPAPLADRGRGNELSRTRFSATRYAPSLSTGDGVTLWVWESELASCPTNRRRAAATSSGFCRRCATR